MSKHLLPLLSAALMLTFLFSCTPEDKIKPETPIKSADWHDVSSSEGTIEIDDISIKYPAGAFSDKDKIAVSLVKKGEIGGDREVTAFYQLTFPRKGTSKPVNIYFNCPEPDKNKQVVVKMPGWTRHTGEAGYMKSVIPGFYSVKNGYMRAEIPPVDPCETEEPFFSIGILQGYTEADTKASAGDPHMEVNADDDNGPLQTKESKYNYAYTWAMDTFDHAHFLVYSTKYSEINSFLAKEIPAAHKVLEDIGFKLPAEMIVYKVEQFGKDEKAWGFFQSSKFVTSWGYIRLNANLLYEFAKSRGTDQYAANTGQIQQTLVHETSHAVHEFVYEPRPAPVRNAVGLLGDEWAMLSEAVGCWTEKFTGDKLISENTPHFGLSFLTHFWPPKQGWAEYQEQGYGMGFFIDYLSRNLGNKAVVQLYQDQHDGTVAGVLDDFRKAIQGTKISLILNDTDMYNEFLTEIITHKRDPRAELLTYVDKKDWSGNSMTLSGYSFPMGVLMHKLTIRPTDITKNINNSLKVTQPLDDYMTIGYVRDTDKNYKVVAVTSDGMSDEVPVETLSKHGGSLLLATFRTSYNKIDDNYSLIKDHGAYVEVKFEMVKPDGELPKIHSVDFDISVRYGDKSFSDNVCPESTWATQYDNRLSVKRNGKGLIISCDNSTSNFQSYVNEKISFYVDSYSGGKVGSVSKIVYDYADKNSEGPVWHMEVESLPVENNTVDPFNENEASWKAKGSNLKVTKFSYKKGGDEYKYIENANNYVRLSMEYK